MGAKNVSLYGRQKCVLTWVPKMCTYMGAKYVSLHGRLKCVLIWVPKMCPYMGAKNVSLHGRQKCAPIWVPKRCPYMGAKNVPLYWRQMCVCNSACQKCVQHQVLKMLYILDAKIVGWIKCGRKGKSRRQKFRRQIRKMYLMIIEVAHSAESLEMDFFGLSEIGAAGINDQFCRKNCQSHVI